MGNLKWILALTAVLIYIPLFADVSAPPIYDAVTAATRPPDIPYETVINLRAEVIYWREMDLDGGCTPYEDVVLTWEPTPGGSETGYEIWATTSTGVFEKIDTVEAGVNEYTDYFINMTYESLEVISYKVRPIFDNDTGPFCEAVSVSNPGYIEPVE